MSKTTTTNNSWPPTLSDAHASDQHLAFAPYAEAVPTDGVERRRVRYRMPKRERGTFEPTIEPSPLTPPGMIQAYGNLFRGVRSSSGWRRRTAIAFALIFVLPGVLAGIGVITLGYALFH
jgi:hypothetical protein